MENLGKTIHIWFFRQARVQTRNQFGFSKPDEVFNFATKGAGKIIIQIISRPREPVRSTKGAGKNLIVR